MKIITLLTDFGLRDGYVGAMKGGHLEYLSRRAYRGYHPRYFPSEMCVKVPWFWRAPISITPGGTIHVAVVDPGVGTHRRAIAARVGDYLFVAPDNGLLTPVLVQRRKTKLAGGNCRSGAPQYWLKKISPVFHGRDIFSPVGAHLAAGVLLENFGKIIHDPILLDLPEPHPIQGGWEGIITRVDHFGNLESNIDATLIADMGPVDVLVGGATIHGLVDTFGEGKAGDLVAMIDSSGVIGVSVVNGSAASRLNVSQGDSFQIIKAQP